MVKNVYSLRQNDDATQFVFFSEGRKGRRWLYNLVFRRRLMEIRSFFEIRGKRGHLWEDYKPTMNYDAFEIVRKLR